MPAILNFLKKIESGSLQGFAEGSYGSYWIDFFFDKNPRIARKKVSPGSNAEKLIRNRSGRETGILHARFCRPPSSEVTGGIEQV